MEIKTDANAFHIKVLAEETVVIALAPTDAIPLTIKGNTWDDDQVKTSSVRVVLGFQNVEISHCESGVLAIFHRDDVIADHGGQDDGLPQMPFLQKGLGLHLVRQGAVNHHPFSLDEIKEMLPLDNFSSMKNEGDQIVENTGMRQSYAIFAMDSNNLDVAWAYDLIYEKLSILDENGNDMIRRYSYKDFSA